MTNNNNNNDDSQDSDDNVIDYEPWHENYEHDSNEELVFNDFNYKYEDHHSDNDEPDRM